MSLRMDLEKKKSQEEMRRLMAERKKKNFKPIKIDNPLAKYNNTGQLMCVLCNSVVRSEQVWHVHVNSKQHKGNVEQAKKLKELTNNFTAVNKHKRTSPLKDSPPEKKIKGILKNASDVKVAQIVHKNVPSIVPYHNEEIKRAPLGALPAKFVKDIKDQPAGSKESSEEKPQISSDQPIPEGFFDDPILDAKARNIEYKDPVEEEWEKFQKEIKEEASASAEIIAGEQEEATAERQIDEIDEQIRNWSRVLDLELKKEETKKKLQVEQMDEDEDDDTEIEANIDEFLDWRAKKAYT